ncbi:MAG: ABC transporter ATP-binding protein [Pseudomonadota bacterium]|nr:ABC transporter ATP-binding protein [Pseudomonadota bacterium]
MSHDLVCRGVNVRFGQFHALRDINVSFQPNRVTALIGPNGAGKTTLMNVLSGLQKHSGQVLLGDQDISGLRPDRRAGLGISRSFQIVAVFPDMTVFENMRLALQPNALAWSMPWRSIHGYRDLAADAAARLETFGLHDVADRPAAELSHGQQKLLELALSLASDPKVLLLDEPLAGVGHGDAKTFVQTLGRISEGRTTVLVEHNMDVVLNVADHIIVLADGSLFAQGTPAEIRADRKVRDVFLGQSA